MSGSLQIPFIRQAMDLTDGALRLVGTAWTAPAWMKTNNQKSGLGFLKEEYYQLWADYHVKFLRAYSKQGIEFWTLTTGNKPSFGFTAPQSRGPSLAWTFQQAVRNNI